MQLVGSLPLFAPAPGLQMLMMGSNGNLAYENVHGVKVAALGMMNRFATHTPKHHTRINALVLGLIYWCVSNSIKLPLGLTAQSESTRRKEPLNL